MNTVEVKVLEWDTAFFGARMARLDVVEMDETRLRLVEERCRSLKVRCLYALADLAQPASLQVLERHAFQLVDIRVTLACRLTEVLEESSAPSVVRAATPADIEALRAIARVSHVDSRYYADAGFSRERCDELYATWIENSCRGFADAVWVAEGEGRPAGYITCDVQEDGTGSIGLFAVAGWAQGRGLGGQLIHAALAWFRAQNCGEVRVVTQGQNQSALRIYQRYGFRVVALQVWFHKWFDCEILA
jgi:dTDP-4-amino-4,6-dideoxy-D-galactose acyltransferase